MWKWALSATIILGCNSGGPPVIGDDGGIPDGGAELCSAPGSVETVACGACGTTDRFCTADGIWAYGTCDEGGSCVPGTTQDVACGACGTQMARCTAACEWEAVSECSDEGGCAPGTRTRSAEGCPEGEDREVVCSEACGYEPAGECQPNDCDEPGALETIPCGRCGEQERFCSSAGRWEYGLCEDEGACMPGTIDDASCGMCGSQSRRCNTMCEWEGGECVDEGECEPGTTEQTSAGCPPSEMRTLQCNDSCVFVEVVECVGEPIECSPACGAGETCRADGVCRCGTGRACGGAERCIDGACVEDDCPEADLYNCRLVGPQCGCTGSQACTVDRTAAARVCIAPGDDREGDACTSGSCAAGLACFAGSCHRWCDTDADCGDGRCTLERLDIDGNPLSFPANLCTISCDPISSDGCSATTACQVLGEGTMGYTDCRSVTDLPLPIGCFTDEFCPAGHACVGTSVCEPYCRVGVSADCSGTCNALPGEPRVDGRVWGTCS